MQTSVKRNVFSTRQMTTIGLVTAVTCILGPLALPLPFSPVPISFTNLVLYLSVYILGTREAFVSYLVYLCIGMAGLPVFSGFSGGFGKLAGPTGGYLIGFFFLLPIAGICIEKSRGRKWMQLLGLTVGTIVCYAFGTAWLAIQAHLSAGAALAAGVLPYIPGDIIKIIIALLAGPVLGRSVKCRT